MERGRHGNNLGNLLDIQVAEVVICGLLLQAADLLRLRSDCSSFEIHLRHKDEMAIRHKVVVDPFEGATQQRRQRRPGEGVRLLFLHRRA